MPYIKLKTNRIINDDQKEQLSQKFIHTFAISSDKKVAQNILLQIQDACWTNFRGSSEEAAAFLQINPGPLTSSADYPKIIENFFPVLEEELEIPANRIYITIFEFPHWGFDNTYIC